MIVAGVENRLHLVEQAGCNRGDSFWYPIKNPCRPWNMKKNELMKRRKHFIVSSQGHVS